MAKQAAEKGYLAVTFEQAGYGERIERHLKQKSKSNTIDLANHLLLIGKTLTGNGASELSSIIDWLCLYNKLININKSNIFLFGHSAGGTLAQFASALDTRIKVTLASGSVGPILKTMGSRGTGSGDGIIPGQLKWFDEAKKKEINDPNALALGTANKEGIPSVRMVLLKGFDKNGFVFYTNLNSQKGNELKENPNASMCFHWKSLLRQIRIVGTLKQVEDKVADDYYNTRAYESRIGAWASKQSSILKSRNELLNNLENYKKKYNDKDNVPRPNYWTGWNLKPSSIEFWLDGENRIHERLKYILDKNNNWGKSLLSP